MLNENIKIKDVKEEIGKLVRSYRKQKNISQKQLSELLNISRITIQNLENGKNFTIDTLLKIVQYFDELPTLLQLIVDKRNDNENIKSLY